MTMSKADSLNRRQVRLSRSDIRELLNLPDDVEVIGAGVWPEPLVLQITLSTRNEEYWRNDPSDGWESEDNESRIISLDYFNDRDDDTKG